MTAAAVRKCVRLLPRRVKRYDKHPLAREAGEGMLYMGNGMAVTAQPKPLPNRLTNEYEFDIV